MTDDKKNVSFVSGLALLLAVLALVLVGWGGVADSPYQAQWKTTVDQNFENIGNRLSTIEDGFVEAEKTAAKKQIAWTQAELRALDAKIAGMKVAAPAVLAGDLDALSAQVQTALSKLNAATATGTDVAAKAPCVMNKKDCPYKKAGKPCPKDCPYCKAGKPCPKPCPMAAKAEAEAKEEVKAEETKTEEVKEEAKEEAPAAAAEEKVEAAHH